LPIGLFKFTYLLRGEKPVFITEQNGWIEHEMKLQKVRFSFLGKTLQIIDALSSDYIIVVSEGIKNYLIKNRIKPAKIHVIQNGTNLDKFYPFNNRNELKRTILNTDKPVIGFMGNISRWQGVDELIDYYAEIRKKVDCMLLIIGDGLYKNELIKKINTMGLEKNIVFLGNVSYLKSNEYMNLIDIAVAPKIKELDNICSPLKIRDYCACGKVVISTKIKGITEFENYGWLWTYESGNKKSFIDLVIDLLENHDITEIRQKARSFAEDNFSWDLSVEKILEIIH